MKSDPWDCKAGPVAANLLRYMDDLSRSNVDLEAQKKGLLEIASRRC